MRWAWGDGKSLINRRKHGLGFETAQLVFGDPLAVSRRKSHPDEERLQTIGMIGNIIVIVAHTCPGPIISVCPKIPIYLNGNVKG